MPSVSKKAYVIFIALALIYFFNPLYKKQPNEFDFSFPEQDFFYQWNLTKDGSHWIISPDSVHQIGCIHTFIKTLFIKWLSTNQDKVD